MQRKIEQHGLDWIVDSAGTESYHIGETPHKYSQKVCLAHGIDISAQRARKFSAKDLERFDKIYAMATDVYNEIAAIAGRGADMSKVTLFVNELHPNSNQSVPDPWYGNEDGYQPVFELINQTCDAIIAKYK